MGKMWKGELQCKSTINEVRYEYKYVSKKIVGIRHPYKNKNEYMLKEKMVMH
mgnify:FL=1